MIPILYDSSEVSFENNGIARLSDCISCVVTEERNGIYECEFEYPITGVHYADITEGRYISVTHDENGDRQPFKIYHRSAPIKGVVTFNAHHKSYELANVILKPFTATSAASAFAMFETQTITDNPFTFWTDKATGGNFEVEVPVSIREVLGGSEGSILDAFGGGDYEFDGTQVKLWQNRGADRGVEIRYGKNMRSITHSIDTLGLYNSVVPYYLDHDGNKVIGDVVSSDGGITVLDYWTDQNDVIITDENGIGIQFERAINQVVPLDLTDKFDDIPTKEQLNEAGEAYLSANQPWIPKENIKVNFVALWQTEEYADIAPLERVSLCDEVLVSYPELGVDNVKMKVIRTDYNVLLDRYDSLQLGVARTSFADIITEGTNEQIQKSQSMMELAIDNATKLITGGMGGHVVFSMDADGKPEEILIMDTEDVATAVHVLRINLNGIGFSSNGINGPYTTAWTLDGAFVADFITAGYLSCNRIQGGTLTLGGANNGNGVLNVIDADGVVRGIWDKSGIKITRNTASFELSTVTLKEGPITNTYTGGKFAEDNFAGHPAYTVLTGGKESTVYEGESIASFIGTGPAVKGWYFPNLSNYRAITEHISLSDDTITFMLELITGNTASVPITIKPDRISFFATPGAAYRNSPQFDLSATNFSVHTESNRRLYYENGDWKINGASRSGHIAVVSSSSKRYKHNITDKIDKDLDAHKLLELPMKQFEWNEDHPLQYADMAGQTIPGFIAEDVAEIYPAAVIHDADGNIESWDERRIIPGMLALIQEQEKRIEDLEKRVKNLEKVMEILLREEM